MNKAIMIESKKKVFQLVTVMLLALLLLVTFMVIRNAFAVEGWQLSINYVDEDNANSVLWSTDQDENRAFKISVNYSNISVDHDYEPGELIITIPGIGGANRESNLEGVIGANKTSDKTKDKAWVYSFNSLTNTYTFINNRKIAAGSTLNGHFEMGWSLKSRDTQNDYSLGIKAKLIGPEKESGSGALNLESNTLTFATSFEKDTYDFIQTPSKIYKNQIGTLNMDDYVFVKYTLSLDETSKSLGIKEDTKFYELNIPSGAKVFATAKYSDDSGELFIEANDLGENKYRISSYNDTFVYIAYPKSSYSGQTINNVVSLYGTYYEDDTESLLASKSVSVNLNNYDYLSGPTEQYTFSKKVYGRYTSTKDELCISNGVIDGLSLSNQYFTSTIGGAIYADASNKTSYEITDDSLYIQKSNGDLSSIAAGKYNFEYVIIHEASFYRDLNGLPLEPGKYTVTIYANGVETQTVTIGEEKQIFLPDSTYKVTVKLNKIDRSVSNFYVDLHTILRINNLTDIDIDNSAIYNSGFVKIYNESGTWLNNTITSADYDSSTNIDFAAKDMTTYGHYLERKIGMAHIHKYVPTTNTDLTGDYYNLTSFTNDFFSDSDGFGINAKIGTAFMITNGKINEFTISTLLPNGLTLKNYNGSPSSYFKYEKIGYNGISANVVGIESPIVTVIEDYNGTGRTYLSFHFNHSISSITNITSIEVIVKMQLYLSNDDQQLYGDDYVLESNSFIDDGRLNEKYYQKVDVSDMDRDGNTVEFMSSTSANKHLLYASSNDLKIQKSVSTSNSQGYETGDVDITLGDQYYYKLEAELGDNNGKNIVMIDNLENESSEWQGKLDYVDITYATALGFSPVVYYSDLTNNTGWSTTKGPNTKAIKIDFGSTELKVGKHVFAIIRMTAPTDSDLLNKKAKNKYSITYTAIDPNDGAETSKSYDSNITSVLIAQTGTVNINAVTINQGSAENASIKIYRDGESTEFKKGYTDSSGKLSFYQMPYGTYYYKVESFGYSEQPATYFTLNSNTKELNLTVEKRTGDVSLVKYNGENNSEDYRVANAIYTLYKKSDDSIVDTFTTTSNGYISFSIPWGVEYYLKETSAPAGYNLNNEIFDISFTQSNYRDRLELSTYDEQKSGGLASITVYELSEDGTTKLSSVVPNAIVQSYHTFYLTDENGHVDYGNMLIGKTTFSSSTHDTGYTLTNPLSSTTAIITADNLTNPAEVKLYLQRKYGKVRVYKTDENNNALPEAVFGLYKLNEDTADYEKVEEFTTDATGQINKEDLTWGKYYFQEIKSPLGYALDSKKYEFTIDSSNAGNRLDIDVVNAQSSGNVTLTKYNTDGSQKLANAEYSLYRNDGTLVKSGLKTNSAGKISVTNLGWGTYYFLETTAPTSYSLSSEKIRFSINNITAGTTQEVSAYDNQDASKNITVYKKIKISDINFEHGNPTFLFEVSAATESGLKTKRQQVTITEDYLDNYKADHPTEQYLEISTIFTGLQGDQTYTVEELSTIRYEVNSIEQSSGTNDGNSKSTITLTSSSTNDYVRFINEKEKNSELSHTSLVTNAISTRKFTSLSVIYAKDGEAVLGGTVIDRDDLKVYATYDDGTTRLLNNTDYTLDITGDKVPDNQKNDLTVTASYTEDGITRTGSFVVTVDFVSQFASCTRDSLGYKLDANDLGSGTINTTIDSNQAFVTGNPNDYVWYSGKLWRVVSIDPADCSVKLITEESISHIAFNEQFDVDFENSYMDQWLQEVFEPTLYNSDNLLVNKDFNFTQDAQSPWGSPEKPANTTIVNRKVGLLNLYEYKATSNYDHLYTWGLFWLGNSYSDEYVATAGKSMSFTNPSTANVRPVINVSSSALVSTGTGTATDPYRFADDISTPSPGTLLNTRVSGEYVKFNDSLFIIVDTFGGLTKITKYIYDAPVTIGTTKFGSDQIYNPSSTTSDLAYDLNNAPTGYYQTMNSTYKNMIVNGTWNLGDVSSTDYFDWHHTTDTSATCNVAGICTASGMIGLQRIGEIWGGSSRTDATDAMNTLITPSGNEFTKLSTENVGYTFAIVSQSPSTLEYNQIYPSMYLANNVKITSGLGTKDSPFELTQ